MAIQPEAREIQRAEHDSSSNVQLKKTGLYAWDADNLQWVKLATDSNGNLKLDDTVSDGEAIDLQDADLTIGTTRGILTFGKDADNKARPIELAGPNKNLVKTQDEHNHLLKEILTELKINNQYLNQIVGDASGVKESDIEIQ